MNIPKPKKRPWIVEINPKIWGLPSHQKLYKSFRWKREREDYLMDNPYCVACDRIASVVDHKIRVRDGADFWDQSNWQSMCKRCHNSKTAKESNRG